MHRLPILIKCLRLPFIIVIFGRMVLITPHIFQDSILAAIAFALVHIFVLIVHLKKCSLRKKQVGLVSLGLCIIFYDAALFVLKNGDLAFYHHLVAAEIIGTRSEYSSLFCYTIDALGLVLAVITLHLQIKDLKHQEFLQCICLPMNGPRVVFTRRLTENQDGFFENVYGEIHIDTNGDQLISYSY